MSTPKRPYVAPEIKIIQPEDYTVRLNDLTGEELDEILLDLRRGIHCETISTMWKSDEDILLYLVLRMDRLQEKVNTLEDEIGTLRNELTGGR